MKLNNLILNEGIKRRIGDWTWQLPFVQSKKYGTWVEDSARTLFAEVNSNAIGKQLVEILNKAHGIK